MSQSQFHAALCGDMTRLGVVSFEASHRMAVLRRHLEAMAATPKLTGGLETLPSGPVLAALAALLLLLL